MAPLIPMSVIEPISIIVKPTKIREAILFFQLHWQCSHHFWCVSEESI